MHTANHSVLILMFELLETTCQHAICTKKSLDETSPNHTDVSEIVLTQTYQSILVTVNTVIKPADGQ